MHFALYRKISDSPNPPSPFESGFESDKRYHDELVRYLDDSFAPRATIHYFDLIDRTIDFYTNFSTS